MLAKGRKQHRCLSVDTWINKIWYRMEQSISLEKEGSWDTGYNMDES